MGLGPLNVITAGSVDRRYAPFPALNDCSAFSMNQRSHVNCVRHVALIVVGNQCHQERRKA